MSNSEDPQLDDELTSQLLAFDEALATGRRTLPDSPASSEEAQTKLERGLACVQLLQHLRPKSPPAKDWERTTSILRGPGKAPSPQLDVPDQPIRIGRFEVRQSLGSGGFGIVYLAFDPALNREVALKIPRAGALADAACLARFEREARAAAALTHSNIVSVHEAGRIGPVSYIALAYCPGHNLSEWLKLSPAPVGRMQAARLALILARAIQYAHAHGILHRDLKPNNILLSPVTESERAGDAASAGDLHSGNCWTPDQHNGFIPRITDFGLARHLSGDQTQTQSGAILGTPCYMAPEQAEGISRLCSEATDVYSLGAILYELLTGLAPFRAETAMETLLLVKTAEPVAPSRLQPGVPRDLETICLKCLQKDPRKRYVSAELLADDLQRFCTGRPIQARPAGKLEHAAKWCIRRPALASSFLALALVTVIGLIGVGKQWRATQAALADEASARLQAEAMQQSALQARQAETAAREQSEISLYHHRVVLAHREWLASNVGRAGQLLDECREDLRDWEWHYVRHLCDSAVLTLRGHTCPVMATTFSRDGKLLASVSGNWFSNDSAELNVWETSSGKLLWTGQSPGAPLMSVAFSPDTKLLATSSVIWGKLGGNVKLWNVQSGTVVHEFAGPPGTFSVCFSQDGATLAAGGSDGKIRLWNVATRKQDASIQAHPSNIFGIGFSPDGKLLASAGWDGTARIWDVNQRKLLRTLSGPVDIRSVEFSPDGNRLVAASFDQSAKIWDVQTGRLLHTYWGHTSALTCARFSPDGRYVVSSDTSGGVQIWDAQTLKLFRTIRGHTSSVGTVAFNPDGMHIVSAGTDQLVRVWNITADQEAVVLDNTGPTQNVVFSPDAQWLAAAGYRHSSGVRRESRVRVWPTADFTRQFAWTGHTDWVTSVAFHPTKPVLISGSADKTARLWNLADGKTIRQFVGHSNTVSGVAFSPNGNKLATSSLDKTVKLWDVDSGKPLALEMSHPNPVLDLVFSHDGKFIVAVGEGGMVKVWDAAIGRELHSLLGHQGVVERAQISPDGKLLATCGRDQTIRVWKVAFGRELPEPPKPIQVFHSTAEWERISGLAFSADSTRLASGGRDHTIRIWDIASGSETLTLRGNIDHVNGLAFSPDRSLMASASTRNIRVWNAGIGQMNRVATVETQRRAEVIWHRKQADESQGARPGQWFSARHHLTWLFDAGVDDWHLRQRRAEVEVELDHWQSAREDCRRSIAQGASDPWPWILLAVERLHQKDIEGYRKVCSDMMYRFRDSTNPDYANNSAWACALAPNALGKYDIPIALATRAVAANPKEAAYQSTLGALQFRAGDYQRALDTLHKVSSVSLVGNPEDWLFLARINERLGKKSDALVWLNKAISWHERMQSNRGFEQEANAYSHERMVEIAILLGEAEGLLKPATVPVAVSTGATSSRR